MWFWCGFFKRRVDFSSVFFIFLFLMIRNSDPLSDTLKDLKQSIRSGLVVSIIQGWQIIKHGL
jgi:hypothetical protein